mmetsp:Transcript_44414/g.102547  ORF Transcript_44414/g.102547 Transcript_44414/m.102547 type:complete len:83 (+) Transcript_44414:411-659(+)
MKMKESGEDGGMRAKDAMRKEPIAVGGCFLSGRASRQGQYLVSGQENLPWIMRQFMLKLRKDKGAMGKRGKSLWKKGVSRLA